MFNYEKCLCDCIKPFCRDANGDCVVPLDNCGGNPWEDCVRGVNCPWWGSLSSGDMCNTGENVPPGVWEIFNTREICCGVHAPFSTVCETKGPNGRPIPTSEPTIALPLVPDTEEVALKFDLSGLPNDVDMSKLKANVLVALKIILAQLKERVPDLKVSQISERLCYGRRLDERRQLRMAERELLRKASICYVIEVVDRGNIQDYETLIVSEARASSDVLLDQIRTKLNYVNVGMYLVGISDPNGSSGSSGGGSGFDDGTIYINGGGGSGNGGSSPGGGSGFDDGTGTIYINGGSGGKPGTLTIEKNGGVPGWGIALIVILLLILFCCIGYWIFVSCRNSKDEKYAVNVLFNKPVSRASNNRKGNPPRSQYKPAPPRRRRSFTAFSNVRDRSRRRDDGRSRSRYESFRSSFTGRVQRSQRPRRSRSQGATRRDDNYPTISLSNPQDPKFGADAFTVNTYMTEKKSALDPSMKAMVVYQPDYAKPDPSLYQPNHAKPDPEGETADTIVLALTNGEAYARKYPDDPSTKSKLEPEEVLFIEAAPLDGSHPIRRSSSRGTIGTLDGSYAYRRSSSRTGTLDPSVNGDDDYFDNEANELYDKYEEYIFGRYAPKSQKDKSNDLEGESSSLTTNDLEVEHERRTKKKSKKKKKKHRDGSESKKTYEENSTPESSERDKVYKECSGVESVESGGENRSIEDSRASA